MNGPGSERHDHCIILTGNTNTLRVNTSGNNPVGNAIIAGSSNTINTNQKYNFINGGTSNNITGATHTGSLIIGGNTNQIISSTSNHCTIIGGQNNTMSSPGSATQNRSVIVGSSSSTIAVSTSGNTVSGNIIIGGSSNSITTNTTHNIICGGSSNSINGAALSGCFAAGSRCSITHSRNFMWADGSRNPFASTAANRFMVLATGGSFIYSNSGLTTGVSLAAGASSWASVSDRNQKENIILLDHSETLAKISNIEFYKYHYKESPKEMVCYGPMAQEWHPFFGTSAKDPLMIDQGDLLGILFSCIKGLTIKNKNLFAHVEGMMEKVAMKI
jgi:hypothetical protein